MPGPEFYFGRVRMTFTIGPVQWSHVFNLGKLGSPFNRTDADNVHASLRHWWEFGGISGVAPSTLVATTVSWQSLQVLALLADLVDVDLVLLDIGVLLFGLTDLESLPVGVCKALHWDTAWGGRGRTSRTFLAGFGTSDLAPGSTCRFSDFALGLWHDAWADLPQVFNDPAYGLGYIGQILRHRVPLFPSDDSLGRFSAVKGGRFLNDGVNYIGRRGDRAGHALT